MGQGVPTICAGTLSRLTQKSNRSGHVDQGEVKLTQKSNRSGHVDQGEVKLTQKSNRSEHIDQGEVKLTQKSNRSEYVDQVQKGMTHMTEVELLQIVVDNQQVIIGYLDGLLKVNQYALGLFAMMIFALGFRR